MVLVAGADQIRQIRQSVISQLADTSAESSNVYLDDESNIQRYFRASGGSVAGSVKRLVASCKWRHETKPDCVDCPACLKDPHSHYLHL